MSKDRSDFPRLHCYFDGLQAAWARLDTAVIQQLIQLLHQARLNGRQVFIMGNGGSAMTASHFACDLAKNTANGRTPLFRVNSLSDSVALMTAYANDESYERIFAGQLAYQVQPDDVVIGISASGNSANVLRAIELANERGAVTVGMSGFDGGMLAQIAQLSIHVPTQTIGPAEDIHLMIIHLIIEVLGEMAGEA
ncbi:MAG: SIS domain-containing protein [Ardenticatenaceae bacterium]|nr:SIS domain-containing protein [Ardenticatenaceae bacterium]